MRHNAQELKQSLSIETVIKLLKELGATDFIEDASKGHIITNTICHNEHSGSPKLYYYPESYSFFCYTGCSCSMDIYEVVNRVYKLKNRELHFSSIVEWVANKSGNSFGFGSNVDFDKKESSDLQWMSRFDRTNVELPPLETYSDRILDVFSDHLGHPEFTEDNISKEAMDTFDIRYYNKDNALIIPHRNIENGRIVGLMSRNLETGYEGFKYYPTTVQGKMYNHSKSQNLYGFYENLSAIKRHKKIIIFEAEKSVLQTYSYFGSDCYAVALSGSNISQRQVDLILSISEITEIQIAMDKEFNDNNESEMKRQTEQILRMGRRFSSYVKTTVLWDSEGILEFKNSPSDQGEETLKTLLKNRLEILTLD